MAMIRPRRLSAQSLNKVLSLGTSVFSSDSCRLRLVFVMSIGGCTGASEVCVSEGELRAELDKARSRRTHHFPKVGIVHFPIDSCRAIKLSMIEYVECLKPEFKRFRFGHFQHFC